MVHVNEGTGTPTRPVKTQASKDKDAVNNIKTLLVSGLINPFISSFSDLLNIATGEKCVSLDILEAKEKGQEALSRAEETISTTLTPVHMLLRYVCYSGTSINLVHLLLRYICYSGTSVTPVHLLLRYISYSGTSLTPVHLLLRYICYSGTSVTPVHMLLRYIYYSGTSVTPVHLLLRYICYSGTSADFPREATETSRITENKYIPER